MSIGDRKSKIAMVPPNVLAVGGPGNQLIFDFRLPIFD